MIKDITIGQFFPGTSVIHKIDPRIKIVLVMLYIISLFSINHIVGYGIITIFTLLVIIVSEIPIRMMLKGLKPLIFLMLFTAVINVFMTEGTPLFTIPFTHIIATSEGVMTAFLMILRLSFLILGTSLLTFTTSPIMLTDGIESLLNPFKKIGVPAHELAMMMSIAIRFIPTLLEETDKIIKAQKARGADFESGNLIKRAKALVPILVPLFISAFRRADELAMAMECRCYRGGENRTRLKELKIKSMDISALSIMLILTTGIIVFEWLIK